MDNQLISLVEKIVEKKLKEMQPMTREPAAVISADSENGTARVRFLSGSEYELLNKTGEVLSEGDSVWVEYRTLPSAGYIAMRNGKAVGLYEEADDAITLNSVDRFKTTIKGLKQGRINVYVGDPPRSREFKVADIPLADIPDYFYVMHLSCDIPAAARGYPNQIKQFSLRENGQTLTTRTPVWVGYECWIQFTASSDRAMELYIEFNDDVVLRADLNYDLYRLNIVEYEYMGALYPHSVDSNYEGAGSIRYSEFVRYVCEEIASVKRRLDAFGG